MQVRRLTTRDTRRIIRSVEATNFINILTNESFPQRKCPPGDGGYGDEARSFVERLEPFLGTEILKSPLDRSAYWETGFPGQDGGPPVRRRTSYGMNNYLSRNYSPMVALEGPGAAADRLVKVPQPDKVVCFLHMTPVGSFGVSDHPHIENWSFGPEPWKLANDQVAIWAAEGKESVSDVAESNYGFVDGSTGSLKFDEVYQGAQRNRFDPNAALPIVGEG